MLCLFTVPEHYVMALAESAHTFWWRFEAQCDDIEVSVSNLDLDIIRSV